MDNRERTEAGEWRILLLMRNWNQQRKEKLMKNGELIFCKISDKKWSFGVRVTVIIFIYKSGLFSEEKVPNWFVHNRRFWELKKVQDSEFFTRSSFASCWLLRKLNTCRQQLNTTNNIRKKIRIEALVPIDISPHFDKWYCPEQRHHHYILQTVRWSFRIVFLFSQVSRDR